MQKMETASQPHPLYMVHGAKEDLGHKVQEKQEE